MIIDGVLLHDSDKTVIAIKEIIASRRHAREITAERARDAFTDIEILDYQDLECQVAYLLCNKDVFGDEWWDVIRGGVVDRAVLFRDALRAWMRAIIEKNGALYGAPSPA
jgi:hypothetical protein